MKLEVITLNFRPNDCCIGLQIPTNFEDYFYEDSDGWLYWNPKLKRFENTAQQAWFPKTELREKCVELARETIRMTVFPENYQDFVRPGKE